MSPRIIFINSPQNVLKFRTDSITYLKDDNQKTVSLKINNYDNELCKLVVKLLLKDHEDKEHFYHLCKSSNKTRCVEVEHTITAVERSQAMVKLDFFGIKKALKKEAMEYLKGYFGRKAEQLYKKNSSTLILQISLVNIKTGLCYDNLRFELSDKNDNILVKEYAPKVLVNDNNELDITFVLENPEKDTESLFLELDFNGKNIRPKELSKPTSVKNTFVFSLINIDIRKKIFQARLVRKGSCDAHSDWIQLTVVDTLVENAKRKKSFDDDYSPKNKIPRSVSYAISENSLQDVNLDGYLSDSLSSMAFFKESNNKQELKSIFEIRMMSKIARVGHDYAFGLEVTQLMRNVSNKLPIVYILQDDVGDSPLHNAILKNQEDRANYILDIVYSHFPNDLFMKNTSNHTALILAPACDMSTEFVKKLINYGFDPKDTDIDGNNPLSIAIEYKNSKVLKVLLDYVLEKQSYQADEIKDLLRKTIIERFFDGYQVFMYSSMADILLSLSASELYLDDESTKVFNEYSMSFNSYITPIPEFYLNQLMDNENDLDVLFSL